MQVLQTKLPFAYHQKNSLLHDKKADEILSSIDYNFEKLQSFDHDGLTVVRAKQFDEWILKFLKNNPQAVVLHLGCGLDTRITRLRPTKSVHWFDVDYPEVIKLRQNFYRDLSNYTMIASSVTDALWLKKIPKNAPVIIVAEGLLEYLTENEVKILLNRLTAYFSHGQMMFDVMNSFAVKGGKASLEKMTGAVHTWAVDDPGEVDRMNKKLKRMAALPLVKSPYVRKLPWRLRILYGILSLTPPFNTMLRLLRYEF